MGAKLPKDSKIPNPPQIMEFPLAQPLPPINVKKIIFPALLSLLTFLKTCLHLRVKLYITF